MLKISNETEFVIIEMGANHIGEIKLLSKIAEPNYGYRQILEAHLEGFEVKKVIKGKVNYMIM